MCARILSGWRWNPKCRIHATADCPQNAPLQRSAARRLHQFGRLRRVDAPFRGMSEGRRMANVGIDDIARQLFERLPEAARTMRRDIESNFRAVLQASLGRLDLVTRTDFDVQSKVLERTRARLEQLELRAAELEKRLLELEESLPPPGE